MSNNEFEQRNLSTSQRVHIERKATMPYYISIGEFQKQLKLYYDRYGRKLPFTEMAAYLHNHRMLHDSYQLLLQNDLYDDLSDGEFEAMIDRFPLIIPTDIYNNAITDVMENDIIPLDKDVFVLRHFHYTNGEIHSHNYFEINYVLRGSCTFTFEQSRRVLNEGELCIIAPFSDHDIEVYEDEATVITICLRKSTFNTTFFSLLSQKDLLSHFFRTILYDSSHANYLLFFTENSTAIKKVIKNLTMENLRHDPYTNNCCISWVNLLFSIVLRNYSQTLQFYKYELDSDFSLVLQYIQQNYQNLTLSELAGLFHYSEPHLSTLIRKNTGHHFTDLVKQLKLAEAVEYLTNSQSRISEIAERVGYHSADHFSRVFRSVYQISPQEYRKNHRVLPSE